LVERSIKSAELLVLRCQTYYPQYFVDLIAGPQRSPRQYVSFVPDSHRLRLPIKIVIAAVVASFHVPSALAKAGSDVFLTDSLGSWQLASGSYADPVMDLTPSRTIIEGGFVSYRGGIVLRLGDDWVNWPASPVGDIVWTGSDSPSAVLKIGGLSAFGFLVEPQHLSSEAITVTLSTGQTMTRYVYGNSGAQFFGFVGPGISWIKIDDAAGGSFALGEFHAVSAVSRVPSVHNESGPVNANAFTADMISGDLVANAYQEQISGSGGNYNSAGLSFDGATDYCYGTGGGTYYDECGEEDGNVGDGTYSIPVDRPSIKKQVIDQIVPVDYDQPAPQFISYIIPQSWSVFGKVMHTVYNIPAQNQCSGTTETDYVASVTGGVCTYTTVLFPTDFVSQVQENGSGISDSFDLVGPATVDNPPSACKKVKPPVGSNPNNTFYKIKRVLGKCGYTLTASSEAVFPNPKQVTPGGMDAACRDTLLVVNASNANQAVDSADDYCPACAHQSGTFESHVDDYLANNHECFATGTYTAWTADTEGETQ
jgi:hypothetical protein